MDQFYQELRKIQKKERNNATLARVEEDFYTTIHQYLDELRQEAIRDPFSNVHCAFSSHDTDSIDKSSVQHSHSFAHSMAITSDCDIVMSVLIASLYIYGSA